MFALGPERYAVELRWVREVITLGHVTPVPHAPDAVAGVVNYRGAITSVLDLDALVGRRPAGGAAHAGDGAVLIEVEELTAALRMTRVIEVSTLRAREDGPPDVLVDSSGHPVPLLDPPALLARAQQGAVAAAAALPARLARDP